MHTYIELIDFLKQSVKKGRISAQEGRTKITAVKRLFRNSPFENTDIVTVDIDMLVGVFAADNPVLWGATISSYRSRFVAAQRDYINCVVLGKSPTKEKPKQAPVYTDQQHRHATVDVPCVIGRDGYVVEVKNLPTNLTQPELDRILATLKPYVEAS